MNLRLGTRGSALARAQSGDVARRLEATGHQVTTEIIQTEGDRVADRAFIEVGAFGVFVREIESALLERRVDLAVHSYKDLPSKSPEGLIVAAVPERVDAADVLLARRDAAGSDGVIPLRQGATVGTSSARRAALVKHLRPDLTVSLLRGNVPTRVRALEEKRYDAIVLAAAGLARLQRAEPDGRPLVGDGIVTTRLAPEVFVPAPAQGALAVQVRAADADIRAAVAALDDPATARTLRAERAALARAEAGCAIPFGAWCRVAPDGRLVLAAVLGLADGGLVRAEITGDDPDAVAEAAWRSLSNGGRSA